MDSRELKVGQVWKNKRQKPTQLVVVQDFYTKSGTVIKTREQWNTPRILYAVIDEEGLHPELRDLHVSSFRLMYPHIAFDLTIPTVEEDK